MRRSFRAEFLLIALALVPDLAVSQSTAQISVVPRLIRYSAALPEGSQKNGAVGVTFSIYRDQYDGAPLWSETQNISADKGANYSVLLGSTRNEGLPIDIFTAGEPRWLEAEINGVKEPRVLIGSVPYAMVASDAQTLGGLPPSAYLRAGTTSTSATTNIIAMPDGVKAAFVSNGSQGYLSVFTDGSGDLGNSALYQSGNTISIGGTTSLGAMTLIGSAPSGDTAGMALFNAAGGGGASVSLDMYNTSANGGIPQAKMKAIDDGSYSDHLTFWTKNPGAANNPVAERVRITSTGNVGIGTSTPGGKLEVAGNLKISGPGSAILFPDGTSQSTGISTNNSLFNTSAGAFSLQSNTSGSANTAFGNSSLLANTSGGENAAFGFVALENNTSGYYNTAIGPGALENNTTGAYNAAFGTAVLESNTIANYNTGTGAFALLNNTQGSNNTATGAYSLLFTTTGSFNTALGDQALQYNTIGYHNLAVGYNAGYNITTGSYNIDIASQGNSSDDHVIRLGDYQTQTFIAGISGVNVSGVPVVVSNTGQLGIASSSRRYKEDIHDMGDASNALMRLRPVTYHYKQPYPDGSKPLDYGLIAEEVAEVYPDLVAHSQDGQIQTVMYQKLTPMLLNEVQRLKAENASQSEEMHKMEERLARLEALLQHASQQ